MGCHQGGMAEVRKDSGGEILASLSLLHSGSVPSFSEVTPGLSDQSITHCLFQGSARIWKNIWKCHRRGWFLKAAASRTLNIRGCKRVGWCWMDGMMIGWAGSGEKMADDDDDDNDDDDL